MKRIISFLLFLVIITASIVTTSANSQTDYKKGDVDLNSDINVMDVTSIQRYIAQIITLTPQQISVADTSADNTVSIMDATLIQLYLSGIIDTFPQPEKPTKVSGISAVASSPTSIEISWNKIDGAKKYWVYVNSKPHTSTTDNSATIKATANTTYEIKITAQLSDSTILSVADADAITVTTPSDETQPPTIPQEYTKLISDSQTDSTLTMSVISDMHFDENDLYNIQTKLKTVRELGAATKQADIDFVANLGDNIIGNVEKEASLSTLNTLFDNIKKESSSPVLHVRGNHDDNGWYSLNNHGGSFMVDEMINDVEWQEIINDSLPSGFVKDPKKPNGGYGYIDHEKSKIRVFMLNSCDIPYIVKEDGSYRYTSYRGHAFSNEQLNFVAQSLMFEDKENPNDWAAVFLTHVPLDSSNADGERFGAKSALIRGYDYMLSIITAYRKGTAFKMSGTVYNNTIGDKEEDFLVDVDIDYSKKGTGEVIAFFSGHTHSNNYTNSAGTKNSLSYGYTFIGTVGSESFTTYVINREECTISAFTYGKPRLEITDGNIVGEPHTGSITSGIWSVKYDQFLPNGENIYNGKSDVHPLYYDFGATPLKADLQTMEVMSATQCKAPRQLTKLIPVKPMTKYILPNDFAGQCLSFAKTGDSRAYLSVNSEGDCKYFETAQRTTYVAFSLDTSFYKDYENFFVKEAQYGVKY